jgi:hypothetical protein
MSTEAELAAQEAAKLGQPPLPPVPPVPPVPPAGPVVLKGDHIPESFRGKTDKEVIELLLNTSTEAERLKETLRQKEFEVEQLRPKPAADQLSDVEKKALKEKEFISDPIGYMEKHHAERMQPLTDEYYKGQAEITLQMAKSDKEKYPEFSTLEKPIKAYLDQMPVNVRGNPMAIDWAYKMAEYPELKKKFKESQASVGMHVQGGGSPPPPNVEKKELDDEEKIVAARFGLTNEDYLKFSKKGSVDEF